MGFIDEILENLGLDGLGDGVKPKVCLVGFESAYLEGVKNILHYDDEEVVMGMKGGKILVKGRELYVKKFCEGDVVVCGKISAIEKS